MHAGWCLVFAVLQGALSFSPILTDLPEERGEWETFEATLRDPFYRLPTTTKPRLYEVTLTPTFDVAPAGVTPFTFDGDVTIYLSPTEDNINQIVMHCNDLVINNVTVSTIVDDVEQSLTLTGGAPTCVAPWSFLIITTMAVLDQDQEYIVRINFVGNIQENMRGFYRSWYNDSSGMRWMGTTQFQPSHARQAFPCYDEPGFKAFFDITIVRDADFSPTISNMPIMNTTILANGKVSETFYRTPQTSTYLLAFIVSHYQVVASTTDISRPHDIYARDNAGSTGDWSLEIGELLLDAMEVYTNISYYDMAENMNMKQAAIPDFSAGAMENWGLLTYREALILYDPLNSNHFYKQRVANIVSHEIAHMWFGNLVTCAWWHNLWLNEGFARFYQYYLTDSVAEELGYSTRFITEQLQTALFSDSVDTAHPLTDPGVADPASVSAHFSTITYARGAAVLRMTQHLLGESTFVAGLRAYLDERKYDVADPHHLFDALQAAADADNALAQYPGINVTAYFESWSLQAGHPLLTVVVDQLTGEMSVVQDRWERVTGVSTFDSLYQVPLTWTRGRAPEFEDLKPSQVLTERDTVINRGTVGNEWVIFNKQEAGFYRVNYDDQNWGLITRALRDNSRTNIHEINRAQIVDDVFQLSRSGVMLYTRGLNILSFLEFEDQYAPWLAAISGYNYVIRRLVHDPVTLNRFQQEIISLSAPVTARLGFSEIDGEPFMDGLLRMNLMQFLCNVGHEQCVAAGRAAFLDWRNNGVFIPANMRPWVYCTGLREGTNEDFQYLWNHYQSETLAGEMVVVLQTLGCARDNTSLEFFLDQIVSNDMIRVQDQTTALNSATVGNEENTLIVFQWLQNNIAAATTAFGSVATPVSYIAGRLLNEEQITEFQTWLDTNREVIGEGSYNTGVNGINDTRANLDWSARRIPEIIAYLDVGYIDDVEDLEVTTPVTEAPVTDAPTTEAPVTDAPVTDAPVTDAPVTDAPVTDAPVTDAPVTDAPVTDVPVTDTPVTDAPVTDAPVTDAPVTDAPVTDAPVTDAPVTDAPVTDTPVTDAPVTDAPVTDAPVTIPPVTEPPVTDAPITIPPVTEPPATDAPTTDAPVTDAPVTIPPVTEPPVTDAPITIPPVTEPPATDAPTTDAPVTDAPVTDSPVTDAPVTDAPVTDAPVTDAPVTDAPLDIKEPDSANVAVLGFSTLMVTLAVNLLL